MKLIGILLALLIIGLLTVKQIGPASKQQGKEVQKVESTGIPTVPKNANEVDQFGKQMNDFVKEEGAKRSAQMEEAEAK